MVEPSIEFLIIKLRSYPSINIENFKILLVIGHLVLALI
jgi:hypothetical protein